MDFYRFCTFIYNLTVSLMVLEYYHFCTAEDGFSLRSDQHALEAIKAKITVDPWGILSKNWTAKASICTWEGVSCGFQSQDQRVVALDLSNKGLVGTISPHIGNLSFLLSLDLSTNSFHGSIPPEIARLRHLEEVYMGNNNLIGILPLSYFKNMPKLEKLYLDNNNLTGTLTPFFLDNMPSLKTLMLGHNSLHGNIPEEIGNRSILQDLIVNNNQLTGLVPRTLFNLSSLRRIGLSSNSLSGSLPNDICNQLPMLRLLFISRNQFTGPIPSSINKCKQLRYLSMSINKFNSSIPRAIGNLTLLKELFLGDNDLQGSIPAEIGGLERLEKLVIHEGNLQEHIPQSIFNMSSLKIIDFHSNSLSGVLYPDTFNLPLLEELYLQENGFITGRLPPGLWKSKAIRRLVLSVNKFEGNIPSEVTNLTRLTHLYLGNNRFTGAIPDEISHLHQLEVLSLPGNRIGGKIQFNISTLKELDIADNLFSGDLPADMGFWLPNLQKLYLRDNSFHGTLPNSITNASKLSVIELSQNSFSGSIPTTFGRLELLEKLTFGKNYFTAKGLELNFLSSLTNCRNLQILAFSQNPLKAFLPASIGNLSTSLHTFEAFECGIKGEFPSEIGNLTNLRRLQGRIPQEFCLLKNLGELYLSHNQLLGTIPTCLGDNNSLTWLFLDSNTFTSTIPSTLWSLNSIVALNLSSNILVGNLPSNIRTSNSPLNMLDLSFNRLSGGIPSSIGGYQMLNKLSLAHNNLQGSVPESFGKLVSLELLDLSQNNLSGVIPRSLQTLNHLKYLNLSFNWLQGEIPSGGQFSNFTASSFMHNKDLCGAPNLEVLPCRSIHHEHRASSSLKYILPAIASIIGLGIAIYYLRRHKKHILTNLESSSLHKWTRVSYYELVRATESFNESNLIGNGAYGSVYRGKLSNGVNVALKTFSLLSERAVNSFNVECEVFRNIRHRNLVRIISSCSNMDFRCLVMEYMSNGSLEQWLYSRNNHLSLVQRLQIMIDVASALEYLHHGHTTPIIHCDMKPSNVLLDEDMNAHVCDFGIAKIIGEEEFMVRTATLGTVGYMAPEYGMEGIISTAADVYSFGILLLETFTRKKPTDEMFCGLVSLRSWVLEAVQHSVFEVIDGNLINDDLYTKQKSLASIFNLAMDCTSDSSFRRINMEETVVRLYKIMKTCLENN